MTYLDSQRKSFFTRASLKLSSMLEDRVLDGKVQEDFVDWCEDVFANKDPYNIAAHVLANFHERIHKDENEEIPVYVVGKTLLSCNFAESLCKHIYFNRSA